MDLLEKGEIDKILENLGIQGRIVLNWRASSCSDKSIGYLGEHLKLIIQTQLDNIISDIKVFVKCMPRYDKWKADYLRETNFFNKEYVVLSSLFKNFHDNEGTRTWRPKLLYIKEEVFVFQDVSEDGYGMPCQYNYLPYDELKATVTTLARFHAQSLSFEERRSKQLSRPYRIWEDYREHLEEPKKGTAWRCAGIKAIIDFLNVFSKYRFEPNFTTHLEIVVTNLFRHADNLMKPSEKNRNVVIHRDLWTNNILLKKLENNIHVLIVDYQTVLYAPPMLDLSSFMFFNSNNKFRMLHTDEVLKHYYEVLSDELQRENIDLNTIIKESHLLELYRESLIFGLTQAALIVPIIGLSEGKRYQTFDNPEVCSKVNMISRSEEFIEEAKENASYRERIVELFDEIVERFIFPSSISHTLDK